MTFPNPLLETHNSAITGVITLGITALTRTPLGFAICLVSNQHSWFYWYLPIAVWFGSLLQWCHLISCFPGDRQGPFCHQAQTRAHSRSPRCTRGVKEAAWAVQTRLELIQQEQNCNSIIKWRQRCGCTASSNVCKEKSSNLNIRLQRELVKYSEGERPTAPAKGTDETNAVYANLSVQICCCKRCQLTLFCVTLPGKKQTAFQDTHLPVYRIWEKQLEISTSFPHHTSTVSPTGGETL